MQSTINNQENKTTMRYHFTINQSEREWPKRKEIPMAGEAAKKGELPHATDGNVHENSYYGTQYGGFSERYNDPRLPLLEYISKGTKTKKSFCLL